MSRFYSWLHASHPCSSGILLGCKQKSRWTKNISLKFSFWTNFARKVKERFVRKHFANIVVNGSPPTGSPLQAKQNLHPTGVNFLPRGNKIYFMSALSRLFFGISHEFCFLCMHLFSYFWCCQKHSFTQNFLKYITGGKQKIGPIYKMAAIPSVWILFLILDKLQQHFVWQFWITCNFCQTSVCGYLSAAKCLCVERLLPETRLKTKWT